MLYMNEIAPELVANTRTVDTPRSVKYTSVLRATPSKVIALGGLE